MHRSKNTPSKMISTNCESHQSSFSHTILKKIFSTWSNKNNILWPFHLTKYIHTEESFSTSLNKNKIFWPFVIQSRNIMLWLIPKTSTLAKRKVSWWAKKRWILQSQFRRSRGKSYLFDIFFRNRKGPNTIFWNFEI